MLMLTTNAPLEEVVKVLNCSLVDTGFIKTEEIEKSGVAYICSNYFMELLPVDKYSINYYLELFGEKFVKDPVTEIWGECPAGLQKGEQIDPILKEDFDKFSDLLIKNNYSAHVWEFEEE